MAAVPVPVTTTIQTQIANLYIAILGRNPEPAGFGYWCDTLANNGGTTAALNAITLGFSNSPEFVATYGGQTTSAAVTLMYQNVLSRAPDAGGLAYWISVANAYITQGYTVAQAYALTGNSLITLAAANTGTADQTLIQGKEATAIATGTAPPTTTYTLTTGTDTFAGQNMAVVGTGTTLTVNDSVTANGTNNSITINDSTDASASGVPSGVAVSGVQRLALSTNGSIGNAGSAGQDAIPAQQQVDTISFDMTDADALDTFEVTYAGVTVTTAAVGVAATAADAGALVASAINAIAGATVATVVGSQVVVTAPVAGTALPVFEVVPSGLILVETVVVNDNVVAEAAIPAVDAAVYDVSEWAGLTSFTATGTGDVIVDAAATTALTLTGTGTIAIDGGGLASTFTTAGGDVTIGATSTVANAYTSVTVAGTSGLVAVNDQSGLAADGITVTTGSTLTSASVTGNTGLATITGIGVTTLTMAKSNGGATVVNSTAGHGLALNLSGVTGGTVTDTIATSLAITTSASTAASTGNTLGGLTVAKVTAITATGTKSVDLGTISATKLGALTISGTGGVKVDVSAAGATSTAGYVATVDTTGSTAVLSAANGTIGNDITIGTSTTFTGGAGTDKVTVGASTKTLTFGSGTDTMVLTGASLGTGGTADGGTGTGDTVQMTLANAVTAGSSSGTLNAKISNFEKLSISASTISNGGDIVDLGYLSQLNSYVKLAAMTDTSSDVLTISNLATGGTVEYAGDIGASAATAISIKDSAFSTTNVLNIKLTSENAIRAIRTVTANAIETININAVNSATYATAAFVDTLTLAADAVTAIVVTGNTGVNLTNTNTTVTSVDASGLTSSTGVTGTVYASAFTWTSGVLTNATNAAITVTGTSTGINTISLDAITNDLINSTITVGGATNTYANVITGGAGIDTITGGAGGDHFKGMECVDIITTGGGNDIVYLATAAVDRDSVIDFTAGSVGAADAVYAANYTTGEYVVGATVAASAFTVTVAATTGHVVEFAFEANAGASLSSGAADSLTGTNLLKALNNGITQATLEIATGASTDIEYLVAYQGGKAFVYDVTDAGTTTTIVAAELALVGVFDNIAVGAFTSANFSATAF